MKKLSLAFIIGGALILSACNGNSDSNTTSTDSTTTSTMSSTDTSKMISTDTSSGKMMSDNAMKVDNDANDFAQAAATGGMMEVELGKIAQKNGASLAVKNFGKMMETDHSKLNDEFKDLAAKKNITLPTAVTSDQQKDIDKLSKETGKDFDKDYVSMMVDDHKKDIDDFKKAEDKIKDTDMKVFIVKALPVLEKHLNAIEQIKKNM